VETAFRFNNPRGARIPTLVLLASSPGILAGHLAGLWLRGR
jgi:hypothetical protein